MAAEAVKDIKEETFLEAPCALAVGNDILFIYLDSENTLHAQEKKEHHWHVPERLPRSGTTFSAALDGMLNANLVVESHGCFYHLCQEKGAWAETLFFRDPEKLASHPLLAAHGESLHFIYLARDTRVNHWWLLHHRFHRARWEEPRVIDFGGGTELNYGSSTVDGRGTVHLAYRIVSEELAQLYYRFFTVTDLTWSRATPVSAPGLNSFPVIAADRQGQLQLAWCQKKEDHYYVVHRRRSSGGWPAGGWKEEAIQSPPLEAKAIPLLQPDAGLPAFTAGYYSGGSVCRYTDAPRSVPASVGEISLSKPGLVRLSMARPGGAPASGWSPADGSLPGNLELPGAAQNREMSPQQIGEDFNTLDHFSNILVNQAYALSSAKAQVEETLAAKNKEMARLTFLNEQKIHSLNRELEVKDKKLQEVDLQLKHTISSLKAKVDQSRAAWDEEKKRSREQLKELQKENHHLKQMLLEKENTITRLENRVQEQKLQLGVLQRENRELAAEISRKQPLFRKIMTYFHQKMPG